MTERSRKSKARNDRFLKPMFFSPFGDVCPYGAVGDMLTGKEILHISADREAGRIYSILERPHHFLFLPTDMNLPIVPAVVLAHGKVSRDAYNAICDLTEHYFSVFTDKTGLKNCFEAVSTIYGKMISYSEDIPDIEELTAPVGMELIPKSWILSILSCVVGLTESEKIEVCLKTDADGAYYSAANIKGREAMDALEELVEACETSGVRIEVVGDTMLLYPYRTVCLPSSDFKTDVGCNISE